MQHISIRCLNDWILSAIRKTVNIPYQSVAHDPQAYLADNSKIKIVKKYLNKYLLLKLNRQMPLYHQKAPKGAKILWFYVGKRNFGDANMDVSGRALLKNKCVDIDLFTLPHLHDLFAQDDIFGQVYSDLNAIKKNTYDFILLSQFNLPSIRLKIKYFKSLPFASVFGFFNGPDRNQTCFSYAGINFIFDLNLSPAEIYNQAKPYLHAQSEVYQSVAHLIPKEPFFTVAIGGIDTDRSYRHWPEFLHYLDRESSGEIPKMIVLVGSENGLEMNERITQEQFKTLKIQTLVGQLTLLQAREIISKSQVYIGCDGGLMHVAHSTQAPSVTLFRAQEPHYLRLTKSCHSTPIQSTGECSAILPIQVIEQLKLSLSKYCV